MSDKKYDVAEYWNARPQPNSKHGRRPEAVTQDVAYIRSGLQKIGVTGDSIFELGPGDGRTIAAYPKGAVLTTLDITQRHRNSLRTQTVKYGVKLYENFIDRPEDNFPFETDKFEVGICSQVFMHQPPEIFQHVFSEFMRVCRSAVVITGDRLAWDSGSRHCFRHDYFGALERMGKTACDVDRNEDEKLYFTVVDDRGEIS